MFDSVLNKPLSQWLLSNFSSDLMLSTASDLSYSGIFKHIQHYESIFTHIVESLRHIQAYLGIFRNPCNPCIFWALVYLDLEAYSKPCETLTGHIQNSASQNSLFRHSSIFRTLCNPRIMQRAGIFEILEYSEPFHNCILLYIQNPVTFMKIGKPCATLEIQNSSILTNLDPDIFKTINTGLQKLHAEFWPHM